eukprot:4855179-Alexandrium_andersonii.AAC.1
MPGEARHLPYSVQSRQLQCSLPKLRTSADSTPWTGRSAPLACCDRSLIQIDVGCHSVLAK